ncbi:Zinc finger protein ENHYDROUS-like protein [Drosera capensis]
MPIDMDSSVVSTNTGSAEASVSSTGDQPLQPSAPPPKKKRNQPGMPDPGAEVIALSPNSLLATNRFLCEICNKGFQRDQNLQLHRRGHNLPWKLRQRTSKEVKKRVYVCPEPSCVHHNPARALGDLTGIKKHFCRKHGEKKWKCEKCSKKYAVQSDWKAHSKICGTREYKCDCGAPFLRRDSFITHRAFCDALAEESARNGTTPVQLPPPNSGASDGNLKPKASVPPPVVSSPPSQPPQPLQLPPPQWQPAQALATSPSPPQSPQRQPAQVLLPPPPPPLPLPPAETLISSVLPTQNSVMEIPDDDSPALEEAPLRTSGHASGCSTSNSNSSCISGSTSSGVFASLFASSTVSGSLPSQSAGFSDMMRTMAPQDHPVDLATSMSVEPISLCLATSLFSPVGQGQRPYVPPPLPAMSATALLHKAYEMGSKVTGGSLLCGLGLVPSSSSSGYVGSSQWHGGQVESEGSSVPSGLGLGLHCDEGSGLKELMMESASMLGPKHQTLDFLGLGIAAGGTPNGVGLSALITSIGGSLDVSTTASAAAPFLDFTGKDLSRNS